MAATVTKPLDDDEELRRYAEASAYAEQAVPLIGAWERGAALRRGRQLAGPNLAADGAGRGRWRWGVGGERAGTLYRRNVITSLCGRSLPNKVREENVKWPSATRGTEMARRGW
jgi:hypothetical protein